MHRCTTHRRSTHRCTTHRRATHRRATQRRRPHPRPGPRPDSTPPTPRTPRWVVVRRGMVLLAAGVGVLRALVELVARVQEVLLT